MSTMVPEDAPKPRLCHLKKWPDFEGYGFNLHAEKGKVGQYIGNIDKGSPAQYAGMKHLDKIIEVNGTNISEENHAQVVQRIKAVPNETKLLVVDEEALEYYKEKKIVVRGDMPNVIVRVSPDRKPSGNLSDEEGSIGDQSDNNNYIEGDGPAPRLCIIKTWSTFKGYGFNLHAEKGKPGQFIGNVDAGSPSEKAGLKEGDKIMEVNGANISQDTHAQVVQKIKANPNRTEMLVLDPEGLAFYTSQGIVVNSSMASVQRIECPDYEDGAATTTTVAATTVATTAVMTNGGAPGGGEGPKLRLCHIRKWPDFQGYGFNLHTEKGKAGQFIGNVDDDSPADAGGLKKGDKLVAVNEQGVLNDDHSGVVSKIKGVPDETRLLVADPDTESYYNSREISLSDSSIDVITIVCPTSRQAIQGPKLRLCHVRKWSDFQGYGFNLHTEKGKPGKFIGQVDEGGPAEAAGLKSGDKLIAVNGQNVLSDEHSGVVSKIKENPSETRILVADDETLNYYMSKGITLSHETENYQLIECPASRQVNGNVQVEAEVNGSDQGEDEAPAEPQKEEEPEPVVQEQEPELEAAPQAEPKIQAAPTPAPQPQEPPKPKGPVVIDGIEFAGSVAEARKRASKREKKMAGVNAQLSVKEKFDMFQRL